MQNITVNLNLNRGSCRILKPLYLGETVDLNFDTEGSYSLILTEPFADSPKDGIAVWAQSSEGKLALTRKALHNAFKKADATQPNMTISAKVFVQDESGATVADGEVAIEYSPASYIMDTADYPTAAETLAQAMNAKDAAERAKDAAERAEDATVGVKDAAVRAKIAAEGAAQAAESAKSAAGRAVVSAGTEAGRAAKEAADAREAAIEAKNALASGSEVIKTALEAEESRAKRAEAALDGRVKELEEISINPSYRLVTLPAGETQLQDRAITHITEENIIIVWLSSDGHSDQKAVDVDWVHKEVHDIGDGNGEVEWYVARFDLKPGFFYPIVPVKDAKTDRVYYIDSDSQPFIPDDPSHEESSGIVSEVSFIPRRVSSGYADYRTSLYADFRTTRPDTGEEVTWKIDAYDAYGSLSDGSTSFYGDYIYLEFGDDYIPPGWDSENYSHYGRFSVSGLSELPKPGDTLSISLELYDADGDSTFATYEGEITLPEDLTWNLEYALYFRLEGDATVRYSTPDGETKEAVATYSYFELNGGSYDPIVISIETHIKVLPGVGVYYNQWESVTSDKYNQPLTMGEEIVFSPLESTDESSGYIEYFYAKSEMKEMFEFIPPVPLSNSHARDFLLCVDLTKDRQIELPGVTEAEEGLFKLDAGRTLMSITEPIAGKLYASTKQLPTESV